MKKRIKAILLYGTLILLVALFWEQVRYLLDLILRGIEEYAIPLVLIGIPLLYFLYKSEVKKNTELEKQVNEVREASLIIWDQYKRDKKWQEEDLRGFIEHLEILDKTSKNTTTKE